MSDSVGKQNLALEANRCPNGQPVAYGTIDADQGRGHPPHPFTCDRSLCLAYLWWFPLGLIGAHHYYMLRPGFGLLYTMTLGLFGIGWLVDGFRMTSLVKQTNRKIRDPNVTDELNKFDAYLLCASAGFLGAHHFYLKRYGFGMLYLCTLGLFGVGWIIDLFRLKSLLKEQEEGTGTRNFKLSDAYLLTIFPITGLLGIQHYYLNRRGIGVLYTLSLGVFGLGWLLDLCRLSSLVREAKRAQEEGEDRRKRLDDAYLLWIPPFGLIGLHHYYLERTRWQCLYLFTLGLFGIGWIVDTFRLPCLVWTFNKWVRNYNFPIPQSSHIGAQYPPVQTITILVPQEPVHPPSSNCNEPPAYQLPVAPPPYPGPTNSGEN